MEYTTQKQPNCECVTHRYDFRSSTWLENCPDHNGNEADALHTLANRRYALQCIKEDLEAEITRINEEYRIEQKKLQPIFKASFEIRQEEAIRIARQALVRHE